MLYIIIIDTQNITSHIILTTVYYILFTRDRITASVSVDRLPMGSPQLYRGFEVAWLRLSSACAVNSQWDLIVEFELNNG